MQPADPREPGSSADPPAKVALRRQLLVTRAARPSDELAAARAAICRHVLDRRRTETWRTVAAYVPLPTEPGSMELLAQLAAAGSRVIVPLLLADRDLDWVRWDGTAAEPRLATGGDALGPDAVVGADLVLVPALAVSASGVRLGRGGGSYDRALARRARAGVPGPAVALLFEGELVDRLPADPWDQPVGGAVTPDGWIELHGNAVIGQDG